MRLLTALAAATVVALAPGRASAVPVTYDGDRCTLTSVERIHTDSWVMSRTYVCGTTQYVYTMSTGGRP